MWKAECFSGSNDSGKSNVIKALNLFFNERTDIFTSFIPENDFNKWYKDRNARGQRNIIIRIHVKKGHTKIQKELIMDLLPKKYSVSTVQSRRIFI